MKIKSSILILVCVASSLFISNSLSADVVLFRDGLFLNGSHQFANGLSEIDSSFHYQGLDTLKITPTEPYQSGGIDFYGDTGPYVGTGNTLLFTVYMDTDRSGYMNGFTLSLSTGSFDLTTDTWTLNGEPGALGDLTGGEWHTIAIDLASIGGFTAGSTAGVSSKLNGLVTLKTDTAGDVEVAEFDSYYIGEIRLATVPELSAHVMLCGLLALGLIAGARRRS